MSTEKKCACDCDDCDECEDSVPSGFLLAALLRDETHKPHSLRIFNLFNEAKLLIIDFMGTSCVRVGEDVVFHAYDLVSRLAVEERMIHSIEVLKLLRWSKMEILALVKLNEKKKRVLK